MDSSSTQPKPNSLDSLFERNIQIAKTEYIKNPNNSDNLTKWGEGLLELSRDKSVPVKQTLTEEAVAKLEDALILNPKDHKALGWLGDAHITLGLLIPDPVEAKVQFDMAVECTQKALQEVPSSGRYNSLLKLAARAPVIHARVHRIEDQRQSVGIIASDSSSGIKTSELHARAYGIGQQQSVGTTEPSTPSGTKTPKKKKSGLMYDILGLIVVVGIVTRAFCKIRHATTTSS